MPKHKKTLIALIVLSALSMAVGYLIWHPEVLGFCRVGDWSCVRRYPVFSVGQPMFYVPVLPIIIFIILFFTPERFFNAWKWFALIFGAIGIPLIIATPVYGSGIVSFDKSYVALTLCILFFIISICIILYQTFIHLRNKNLKK